MADCYESIREREKKRIHKAIGGTDDINMDNNDGEDKCVEYSDVQDDPAVKAVLSMFSDVVHPDTASVALTEDKIVRFKTAMRPMQELREKVLDDVTAQCATSIPDMSIKTLKIVAINSATPMSELIKANEERKASSSSSTVAAIPQAPNTRVSNDYQQESGGNIFFENAIEYHMKIADSVATANAMGSAEPRVFNSQQKVTLVDVDHAHFYLIEANPLLGERSCVNGQNCKARRRVQHPEADETSAEENRRRVLQTGQTSTLAYNPNPPKGGIILKEFLTEDERKLASETPLAAIKTVLPPQHRPCLLCIRDDCTKEFIHRKKTARAPHFYPIEVKGGYKRSACLPFACGTASRGIQMPMRYFSAAEYKPISFKDALAAKLFTLLPGELEKLNNATAAEKSKIKIRCYYEISAVHFFEATRWLSSEAVLLGDDQPFSFAVSCCGEQSSGDKKRTTTTGSVAAAPLWQDIAKHSRRSVEVVRTLFDSGFVRACMTVKKALLGKSELATLCRTLRHWAGAPPHPLSMYSICATVFARAEVIEDVKQDVAREIDAIRVQKELHRSRVAGLFGTGANDTINRPEPTAQTLTTVQREILARRPGNDATSDSNGGSNGDGSNPLIQPLSIVGNYNSQRGRGRGRGRGRFRHNKDAQPGATAKPAAATTTTSKSVLMQYDAFLSEISLLARMDTPLLRWLVGFSAQQSVVSDGAILGAEGCADGCAEGCAESTTIMMECALGPLNPDLHQSSSLLSSHTLSFKDESKRLVRVVYPSHRETVLSWLAREFPLVIKMDLFEFIEVCSDDNESQFKRVGISVEEVLAEFWKTSTRIRRLGLLAQIDIMIECKGGSGGSVGSSGDIDFVDADADAAAGLNYAFAASIVARIRIAEQIVKRLIHSFPDDIVYFLFEFELTHIDLAALFTDHWSRLDPSVSDERLVESGAAERFYPLDSRNRVDCDALSLDVLLTHCKYFEQCSDNKAVKNIMHVFPKAAPRACNARDLPRLMDEGCISNYTASVEITRLLYITLLGAYPHARVRADFYTAVKLRKYISQIESDIYARALENDTRLAFRQCVSAENDIISMASSMKVTPSVFEAAFRLAEVFETAGALLVLNIIEDSLGQPFLTIAKAVRSTLRAALVNEVKRQITLTNTGTAHDAAASAAEQMVKDTREYFDPESNVVKNNKYLHQAILFLSGAHTGIYGGGNNEEAKRALVEESVRAFHRNFDSMLNMEEDEDMAEVVGKKQQQQQHGEEEEEATGLRTQFDDVLRKNIWSAVSKSAANRIENNEGRFIVLECDTQKDIREILHEAFFMCMPRDRYNKNAIAARSDRAAAETIKQCGPAIINGLPYLVFSAISDASPDLFDVWQTCMDILEQTPPIVVAYSLASTLHAGKLCEWIEQPPNGKRRRKSGGGDAEDDDDNAVGCCCGQELDGIIQTANRFHEVGGTHTVYSRDVIKRNPARQDMVLLLSDIGVDLVKGTSAIANRAVRYINAMNESNILRKKALEHIHVMNLISGTRPFVAENPVLVYYVMRETLLAGMSRNSVIADVFFSKGKSWMPEWIQESIDIPDTIRRMIYDRSRQGNTVVIPNDDEISAVIHDYVAEVKKKAKGSKPKQQKPKTKKTAAAATTAGSASNLLPLTKVTPKTTVLRRYKGETVTRFFTLLYGIDIDLKINKIDICAIARLTCNLLSRRRLMLAYLLEKHAAHIEEDASMALSHDADILKRFGMCEHGLAIIACMHDAYNRSEGDSKFIHMIMEFTGSEFVLAYDYYSLLSLVHNVNVIPILSRSLCEKTIAALCEKSTIEWNTPISPAETSFYVCDYCGSIVKQLTPRNATSHFEFSSCDGITLDDAGRYVCPNLREIEKKEKLKAKRIEAEAMAASEATAATEAPPAEEVAATAATAVGKSKRINKKKRAQEFKVSEANVRDAASMIPDSKLQRVRGLTGLGRVIEFKKKYRYPKECTSDSKLDVVLSWCCGKWMRYSNEDWLGDSIYCSACSNDRRSVNASNTCFICFTPFDALPASTSMTNFSSKKSGCRRARAKNANNNNSGVPASNSDKTCRILSSCEIGVLQKKVNSLTKSQIVPRIHIGNKMPVSPCSPNVVFVFDDEVTFGLIPIGICSMCVREAAEWPNVLSQLRASIAARMKISAEKYISRKIAGYPNRLFPWQ